MSKIDSWMLFILSIAIFSFLSFYEPNLFSDSNVFLASFVNHELLNFIGLIVTITLASTANIYMELTRKEKEAGEDFLRGTKKKVRQSALSLVYCLILSVVLVVIKPILPDYPQVESLSNTFGISIILWGVLVILDITKLSFKL